MGYAGYVPAKMPPAKPTEAEAAVQAVKSMEALEIMRTLLYNCAVAPKEQKFRAVKLTNKKVAETLVAADGGVDAMLALGWARADGDDTQLVVPAGRFFSMGDVRVVEAAKEKLAKDQRGASRSNLAAMVSVQA